MTRRSAGGAIGSASIVNTATVGGVYNASDAAQLVSIGQFPGSANAAPVLVNQAGNLKPTISNVQYCNTDYAEYNPGSNAGPTTGTSLRIYGANFLPNTRILINGNIVNTVSKYVSATEMRTANVSLLDGSYTLAAFTTSNVGTIYTPGVQFRDMSFTIGSNLGFTPFNTFYSNTITTQGTGVTLSVVSGALPTNISLNSTTGVISGAVPTSYGPAQQSTFTVRATNAYGLTTDQPFSWMIGYYPVNYFVVAGGGGGASSGSAPGSPAPGGGSGGGGAGGLVTGQTVLGYGLPYTITVGAGGIAGPSGSPINFPGIIGGGPGWSSNIYQSSTAVVTTSGGGGGGKMTYTPVAIDPSSIGGQGGSGGGGGAGSIAAPGGLATGSPAINISGTQGYPGGLGASTVGGGGGGGAAGAGGGGIATGGNRGLGLPAAQFGYPGGFAYGGHGGSPTYNGFFDDRAIGTFTGNAGYGAAGGVQAGGGAGAAGTIILAIPTPYYPGSAPGATVTTLSGNTVLRYNTSTTFTA